MAWGSIYCSCGPWTMTARAIDTMLASYQLQVRASIPWEWFQLVRIWNRLRGEVAFAASLLECVKGRDREHVVRGDRWVAVRWRFGRSRIPPVGRWRFPRDGVGCWRRRTSWRCCAMRKSGWWSSPALASSSSMPALAGRQQSISNTTSKQLFVNIHTLQTSSLDLVIFSYFEYKYPNSDSVDINRCYNFSEHSHFHNFFTQSCAMAFGIQMSQTMTQFCESLYDLSNEREGEINGTWKALDQTLRPICLLM